LHSFDINIKKFTFLGANMKTLDFSKHNAKNEGTYKINKRTFAIHFIANSCNAINWKNYHFHNEYIEILYVHKGRFKVMLNGEIISLPKGSLFIIGPGELHTTVCDDDPKSSILMCIRFMPDVLFPARAQVPYVDISVPHIFKNFGHQRYFSPEEIKPTYIPSEFLFLNEEVKRNDYGYALALPSVTMRIFGWLVRYWYKSKTTETKSLSATTTENMNRIKHYLNENYLTATLKSTASACGLSYSYLSRKFTSYMDMNFNDYVNLIKINHSLDMLTSSEESITDIAFKMGFSSASHYISTFKKLKNMTPKEFRKLSHSE